MNNQLTMFELFDQQQLTKASARRTDPITSHDAARCVELSGRAGSQRQAVLQAVRKAPGSTSAELGLMLPDFRNGRHTAGRRLPELEQAGLVRRGAKRQCNANGTMAIEWWPA